MKKLNKDSRIALYYQLVDIILKDIESGVLKEESKLPSEREFCEKYEISRATVRQAIAELEKNNIIYKIQGKGTFIAPKKMDQPLVKFYSFTEEMKKLGKIPKSKILDFALEKSNDKISKILNIEPSSKIYKIVRLRLTDDIPLIYETTYLPANIFPKLTLKQLEKLPLYEVLKNKYDIKFSKAEESFLPILPQIKEANLLDISIDSPCIKIERITYSEENIIEFTESVARGDKFKYKVILNAENSTF